MDSTPTIIPRYTPPTPTWRLCHPVNIYVYRNGIENEKPCLVHIPMEKKKNMTTVLEAIGTRMKLSVGYPIALYHMDGQRVCKTYELEMYNNYVVVTNLEKRFKCVDYGKLREPLVVIGPYSKHVNTLKMQNKKFDLFCRRKMARKPLHELMATSGDQDGLGPSDFSVGKPCGALCHKVVPRRDRPTQCCSDEIMCVEGAAMDVERDECRIFQREMERKCFEEERRCLEVPPGTTIGDEDAKLLAELQSQVKDAAAAGGTDGPLGVNKNLVDLMLRYKDVGSDIFRLFQEKINRDLDEGAENKVSDRWQIPEGSNLDMETQKRVQDELIRLVQQSCQFSFDKSGNFVFTEGCNVPGGGEARLSDVAVGTDREPVAGTSKRASGEGEGQQRRPSQQEGQLRRPSQEEGQQRRPSQEEGTMSPQAKTGGGSEGPSRRESFVANMLMVEEIDEENNISFSSIPGLISPDSKKTLMAEEGTATSEVVMEGNEEEMEGWTEEEFEEIKELNKQLSKQRVSKMESQIQEIVGNMRRSLEMSRSNSMNGGELPPGMNLPSPPRPLAAVQEEEEDEFIAEVKATISNGSNKSKKSSKRGEDENEDDRGGEEDGGGEFNVYSLIMETRNPFREGRVPPLAGKLHKDRLEKLFAENPFRRYYFHGDEMPNDSSEQGWNDNIKTRLPPEGLVLPPPPSFNDDIDTPPTFSPRCSKTEWWPPKQRDVFLQQINDLVHRHDNTKATSPPPPLPLIGCGSTSTFTVGPSPRLSRMRMMKNVACGQSRTDIIPKKKPSNRRRNVCAQVGEPHFEDDFEIEEFQGGDEVMSSRRKPRCYEGGTQTKVESLVLPSEDEKPAGIYEGYQESIKSDDVMADMLSSDNDGDDERKVYYRRRRESKKIRRKRKEHHLHPCSCFSHEEEEYVEDEEDVDKLDIVPKPVQQVRFVINNGRLPNSQQQYPQSSSCFPGIPPSPQQQQPIFVQASSPTPTTLPFLTRHSTQLAPPTIIKTMPGGFITGGQTPFQLPLIISQQSGTRGGFILPSPSNNTSNMISGTQSQLLRQPIIFTTTQPSPSLMQQHQQPAKFLPLLQPQNTSMRLIRLIHPPPQQLMSSSPPTSLSPQTLNSNGALQAKLVQMMSPSFQPLIFSSQQPLSQQRPQQQQLFYINKETTNKQ